MVTYLMKINMIQLIKSLFIQRDDTYAEQNENGQYIRIDRPLTDQDIKDHLDGKRTIGVYQYNKESKCKWICYDYDCANPEDDKEMKVTFQQAKKLYDELYSKGLPVLFEFSGYKGYHVWIFIEECEGKYVKKFAKFMSRSFFPHEIFPKQESVNGGYGNLVKLPLAIHKVSKKRSQFYDVQGNNFTDSDVIVLLDQVDAMSRFHVVPTIKNNDIIDLLFFGADKGNRHESEWIIEKELYVIGYNPKYIELMSLFFNSNCKYPKPESMIIDHLEYLLKNPEKYLQSEIKYVDIQTSIEAKDDIEIDIDIKSPSEIRRAFSYYIEKIASIDDDLIRDYLIGKLARKTETNYNSLKKKLADFLIDKSKVKTVVNMADLLNGHLPDILYWIKPILPKNSLILIGGKPGSMKSLLALTMSLSVSSAENLFGIMSIENNTQVLLYDLENDERTQHMRASYIITGGKYDYDKMKNLTVSFNFNKNNLAKELDFCKGFDVIILDSYRRFLEGDENDSKFTDKFFSEFLKPLKDLNKTVIILHHYRKGNVSEVDDQDIMELFRGSSDVPAQFDVIFGIEKLFEKMSNKQMITELNIIKCKNRMGIPITNFSLRVIKSDLEKATYFEWLGEHRLSRDDRITDAIMGILADCAEHKRGEIVKSISQDVGATERTIDRHLERLMKYGEIYKPKKGFLQKVCDEE